MKGGILELRLHFHVTLRTSYLEIIYQFVRIQEIGIDSHQYADHGRISVIEIH